MEFLGGSKIGHARRLILKLATPSPIESAVLCEGSLRFGGVKERPITRLEHLQRLRSVLSGNGNGAIFATGPEDVRC
jgi:hypothetical protein